MTMDFETWWALRGAPSRPARMTGEDLEPLRRLAEAAFEAGAEVSEKKLEDTWKDGYDEGHEEGYDDAREEFEG